MARAVAELARPVTPAALTAGSVIGYADLTLPNSLGFQGRIYVMGGSTAGKRVLKNPAFELWDRENDRSYIICARMLHRFCCNNFVRSTALELTATVRGLLTSYATGTTVDLRRALTLLTEVQNIILQPGEDPDFYFARLYRLRLQLQQIGCTADEHNLKRMLCRDCQPSIFPR